MKTKKCNVSVPHHSFRPYGVPPFATFRGESTLGAVGVPGEMLTVSLFEGLFDDKGE